jgi:Mrp family chromosome partitioning ATPase
MLKARRLSSFRFKDYFERVDKVKGPMPSLSQTPLISRKPIPNVKKIIVVASGKGGVGKSTVSGKQLKF